MKVKRNKYRVRLFSGEWWNNTIPKLLTTKAKNSKPAKALVWLWNDFESGMFFYSGMCHRCGKTLTLAFIKTIGKPDETKDLIIHYVKGEYQCSHCGAKIKMISVYKTAEAMRAGLSALLN